jgi:hypothetical protein
VASYISASSFSFASIQALSGDGIIVAWVDAAADLHISMVTVQLDGPRGPAIDSAVVADLVVLTGTYTIAGLDAGNFDFLV